MSAELGWDALVDQPQEAGGLLMPVTAIGNP